MIEIIKTDEYNEIYIPESLDEIINLNEKLNKIQKAFAIEISNRFNIDYNNIINLIPATIIKYENNSKKNKYDKKNKIINTNNWKDVKKKEELKNLKLKELKEILIKCNMKPKGRKKDLINKIWNILHPEIPLEIDNDKKLLNIIQNSNNIIINNIQYKLVKDKNWLFFEQPEIFEYIGILKNNNIIKCNAPNELTELM